LSIDSAGNSSAFFMRFFPPACLLHLLHLLLTEHVVGGMPFASAAVSIQNFKYKKQRTSGQLFHALCEKLTAVCYAADCNSGLTKGDHHD